MGVSIGSLFSGIGGFELGLERGIPGSRTVWQVEQDGFCQEVLQRHWPDARLFADVRDVGAHNLDSVDVICGGFPCQDISVAGDGGGLNGKRSGLWWRCTELLARYDRKSSSWRTLQLSLFGGCERYLGGLPRSGMMRNGQLYPLPNLEHPILGTGCSLLPTPCVSGHYSNKSLSDGATLRLSLHGLARERKSHTGKLMRLRPSYVEWMMGFPGGWIGTEHLATPLCPSAPSTSAGE